MKKDLITKVLFSSIFAVCGLLDIFCPYFSEVLTIKSIFLIILSFLPWIGNVIETIEIIGIGHVKLANSAQKRLIEEKEEEIEDVVNDKINKISYQIEEEINNIEYPLTKLAYIYVRMEQLLNDFAVKNEIENQFPNINLAERLNKIGKISKEEHILIRDLWRIFKKAMKNMQKLDKDEINWAIERGLFVFKILYSKVNE